MEAKKVYISKSENNSSGITFSILSARNWGQHTTEWLCNILSVLYRHGNAHETHDENCVLRPKHFPSRSISHSLSFIRNSNWSFWCDVNIFNYIRNKRDQMQTVYFSWWIMHLTVQCSSVQCKWTLKDRLGIECIYVPKASNETQSNTWRVFVCIFCS